MTSDAYFERLADARFRPAALTTGAWSADEQHVSPSIGLLVHEVERDAVARGAGGLALSRLSVDILGAPPIDDLQVTVDVVRPGRTIELVEARATAGARTTVLARAWRLLASDTGDAAGGQPDPMPPPAALPLHDMAARWPSSGFIGSLVVRRAPDARPGRGRAWVDTPHDLVAGEDVGSLARFALLLDVANGIAPGADPESWFFANVDLTAHLHRTPVAGPVGLDVHQVLGRDGLGVTDSVLHDVDGPVGRSTQSLTVRRGSPRAR